jgi:subtilisin family serine protease
MIRVGKSARQALALASAVLVYCAVPQLRAAERVGRTFPDAQQQEVELFVRLATPSVAELNIVAMRETGKLAAAATQRTQAARVDAEQAAFRPRLQAMGITELSTQRVGANGLRVRARLADIEILRALPGVISVGRIERHIADNAESVPWIGAPQVWERLGVRGEGVRIGVIDSGIDYLHANFGGPGTREAYAVNNKNVIEPGTFPTAKVVGGFDFAGPTYDATPGAADPTPDPDPDPLDGVGHGSHVAGSAAGVGVPGAIGSGVAPQAQLYAFKVFNDTNNLATTTLTSLAIERAMDPNQDGEMSDHLDVINLSLGSPFGEPADASAISLQNAVDLGIIVATSAGNSGAVPYITGAPGVTPGAISTAAMTPGGRLHPTLEILAPAAVAGLKVFSEGTSPARLRDTPAISAGVVRTDPLDACTPLLNAAELSGKIALIRRGVCFFQVKVLAAQAAGARAVIVTNTTPGTFGMILEAPVAIPAVMIDRADGDALIAQATATAASPVSGALDARARPDLDNQIATFSSRGPGSSGNSSFKPDLAAPGVAIISTGVGTGNGAAPNQGTSMASPHTAGAAALLHQLHPKLPPGAIKAMLQNSTDRANPSGETSLARQGVGVLRVDRAVSLTSFAEPGGVSFGRLNPQERIVVTRRVTLRNLSQNRRSFRGAHEPQQTYPGVSVVCPRTLHVGGRGAHAFEVQLLFDPDVSAAAERFDSASISQTEVDGWCVFSDGDDTLRVGYLAVVDAASGLSVQPTSSAAIEIQNRGPASGVAEGFTLAGVGGSGAEDTYSTISRLGFRRGDPALFGGVPVIEFAVTTARPWEHISNLVIDLFLDTNRDGKDDVHLTAQDWTSLQASPPAQLGRYLTAQFRLTGPPGVLLDWIVDRWDFNDRVVVLPFTQLAGGGLTPDSFNYRLVLTDRQNRQDVQTGSIDLADEIVPDVNSFTLERDEKVRVDVNGRAGRMLWLFPVNPERIQEQAVFVSGSRRQH